MVLCLASDATGIQVFGGCVDYCRVGNWLADFFLTSSPSLPPRLFLLYLANSCFSRGQGFPRGSVWVRDAYAGPSRCL